MTAMQLLRFERDQKLRETDHIVMIPDWPVSDETKNRYLQYRTELRDLPQNSSPELDENGNLINVQWPKKPQ